MITLQRRRLEGAGWVVLDAGVWGLVWVLFAAAAGLGLTVAARSLLGRSREDECAAHLRGYNALAPHIDMGACINR